MPLRKLLSYATRPKLDLYYQQQPVLSDSEAKDNLALIGSPQEVTQCFAELLRQLDTRRLPIFLLGTEEDGDLLDLPEILQLNLVRCILLPTLKPQTTPATLRANLEQIQNNVKVHFANQEVPIFLFTGRNLGQHWLFLLGRMPQLRAQGVTLISDVTLTLRTPLPNSFRRFIVWPDEQARYDKAVERWHRHDQIQAVHHPLWREHSGPSCYVIRTSGQLDKPSRPNIRPPT